VDFTRPVRALLPCPHNDHSIFVRAAGNSQLSLPAKLPEY